MTLDFRAQRGLFFVCGGRSQIDFNAFQCTSNESAQNCIQKFEMRPSKSMLTMYQNIGWSQMHGRGRGVLIWKNSGFLPARNRSACQSGACRWTTRGLTGLGNNSYHQWRIHWRRQPIIWPIRQNA